MDKKILLIHPEKHHAYYSLQGIVRASEKAEAFFGMYDNSILMRLLLLIAGKKDKLDGYRLKHLDGYIRTNPIVKVLFLLKNKYKRLKKLYLCLFQRFSEKYLKRADVVHVLQNYCDISIRKAKEHKKIVVYEQITPFISTTLKYLCKELERQKVSKESFSELFDEEAIKREWENIRMSDYIHVPSEFVMESLVEAMGNQIKNKIVFYPYGADIDNFRFKARHYDGRRTLKLLCVARVTLLKGTGYLIEAMKDLGSEDIHLTYIGTANGPDDYRLASELKSMKNVTYIESIPHTKIEKYYLENDLFVLPSLSEGSALVVYEALSTGMPCIVTRNTGSVITDGEEGLIIDCCSKNDIIAGIRHFIDNPGKIAEMSPKARKTAENYSWDRYSENVRNFYENIVLKDMKQM